jgi:hypothetical protein
MYVPTVARVNLRRLKALVRVCMPGSGRCSASSDQVCAESEASFAVLTGGARRPWTVDRKRCSRRRSPDSVRLKVASGASTAMDPAQLAMLLDGIDLNARRLAPSLESGEQQGIGTDRRI